MTVTINGNAIKTIDDFYKEIERQLLLGECPWGENLDSLDEVVQYRFNYTNNRLLDVKEIVWLNSDASKENLGRAETISWWKNKLAPSEELTSQKNISANIESLSNGFGRTLFETLVEILKSNEDIKLTLR